MTSDARTDTGSALYGNPLNIPDFREWCTKVNTLAEAEKLLGAKVPSPSETRGRKLKGIYVAETYYDGTPVERWDRNAVLDFGNFLITIFPQRSEQDAVKDIEGTRNGPVESRGLGGGTTVKGHPGSFEQKGEAKPFTDASGKKRGPWMTVDRNLLRFCAGREVVWIDSESLSIDDLHDIAESMDFD